MWKKLNEFTIYQINHYASIVNKDTHMITWKTKDGLLHIASYYTINNCVMDSDNSTKFSIWRYENDATR